MTNKEKRRLLLFLEAMADTAVDIFWGGDPDITEEERDGLKREDYENAYRDACLEYIIELEETAVSWLTELYSPIGDKYGKHLKRRLLQNQLKD